MRTSRQESLWVLRARYGDREALELLLRGVQPSLQRYLSGLVGSADADDVLQEVLVQVYRQLRALREPELFRPWVFRIASRHGFRLLKRRGRGVFRTCEDAVLEDLPAPDAPPSEEALEELLALDSLSPASRAVLALHFQEEMSLPEVAAVLAIPLGTVKSRLAYGLASLRKQLGNRRRL